MAFAPACYGYYILPTYPSDLAAISFDRSGTTRIGRFVINHSFILPGLIGVGVSRAFGWVFAAFYGFFYSDCPKNGLKRKRGGIFRLFCIAVAPSFRPAKLSCEPA